jgi:hypothetical protein
MPALPGLVQSPQIKLCIQKQNRFKTNQSQKVNRMG